MKEELLKLGFSLVSNVMYAKKEWGSIALAYLGKGSYRLSVFKNDKWYLEEIDKDKALGRVKSYL